MRIHDRHIDQSVRAKIANTVLELAKETDWAHIHLRTILEKAGYDINFGYGWLDRSTIFAFIHEQLDRAIAKEAPEMEENARERLFDLAMLRFEAMESHRSALLKIIAVEKTLCNDPIQYFSQVKWRLRTSHFLMNCAGLEPYPSHVMGLAHIMYQAEKAWVQDEYGDFAKTMAILDSQLIEAGQRLERLDSIRRKLYDFWSLSNMPARH